MATSPYDRDADAPEVAFSRQPELVSPSGTLSSAASPIPTYSNTVSSSGLHSVMVEPPEGMLLHDKQDHRAEEPPEEKIAVGGEKRRGLFGWSLRRTLTIGGIVLLVIAAIAVGVGVGLAIRNDDSGPITESEEAAEGGTSSAPPRASSSSPSSESVASSSPSTTDTSRETTSTSTPAFGSPTQFASSARASDSACYDNVCPSMLTAAWSSPRDSTLLLLALGEDGEYWYRETDGETWLGDWESIGGTFVSRPAAASVVDGRIHVVGVSEELNMLTRSYNARTGTWDRNWTSLGGPSLSEPATCTREGKLHVFTTNSRRGVRWKTLLDSGWDPSDEDEWHTRNGREVESAVGLACDDGRLDVVAYGETEAPFQLMVSRFNSRSRPRLTEFTRYGGDFAGHPVATLLGNRTYVFGVGADGDMYYTSWRDTIPASPDDFESLGASFESVASVLATGDDRLDVLAVGTDGRLKKMTLLGGEWQARWEDLGGFFHSAPLVVRLPEARVAVFGIGEDGEVIHGLWDVSGDEAAWGRGGWFVDGGNFTTRWFSDV
ncbi:hypothetical protein B0I35DRAFT_514232 [Stachybotrys elegans]|uniref:PLL-like beta propeller domain-containing protein n=1 Tax=Stachybotrys elegans TaxID=80388 RepID=A0A8K0SLE8_9HYPO|nr:hypothetical protein B0I35DRAFT_514232 [Stachybotrys elegans]